MEEPHVPCGSAAEGDLPWKASGKSRDARTSEEYEDHFNPLLLIVKLRNILTASRSAEKSKGGKDSESAPPLKKIKWIAVN